jgi:hypothetical protein
MLKGRINMTTTLRSEFNRAQQMTMKRLNNIYISADLIISILESSKEETIASAERVFQFPVPSTQKDKIRTIPRKKHDFIQFLNETISFDLHKYMIISAISLTEDYLASITKIIYKRYPRKLTANSQTNQTISINKVLDATDLDEVIDNLIDEKIISLFYGSPQKQFEYFKRVFQFNLEEDVVNNYIELKATRDLLVHADGIVNHVYVEKAGSYARAEVGQRVELDAKYFQNTIRYCKKLVGIIRRDCLKEYC